MKINHLTINVWHKIAAKPSILLVHGIGVSSEYYLPFMDALSTDFDVHSIDLPGYGATPKPRHALTIEQLADIVVGYARYTGKTFVLVGQSMGSQIITHAAIKAPELFTHLLLVAPTSNIYERTLPLQGLRLAQDFLHESFTANRVVLRNYLRMGPIRYLKTAAMMVNDHIEDTISQINLPILIVVGEHDAIAPKRWGSYLASRAPNARVITIKSAPHLIQYAHPHELAQLTRKFSRS